MRRLPAPAKLNLSLVVGPLRDDGKHEVATVLQRISLADRVSIQPAAALDVRGFAEDTLVRDALLQLAEAAGAEARWSVRIEKQIPVYSICEHHMIPFHGFAHIAYIPDGGRIVGLSVERSRAKHRSTRCLDSCP